MNSALLALFDAALAGAAALYVWVLASQLHTPIIRPIQKWLRTGWRRPMISCPWCSGFWLGIAFTVALQWHRLDWIVTPITALAAAAICGYVGSLTPGIEDEEEIEADEA